MNDGCGRSWFIVHQEAWSREKSLEAPGLGSNLEVACEFWDLKWVSRQAEASTPSELLLSIALDKE